MPRGTPTARRSRPDAKQRSTAPAAWPASGPREAQGHRVLNVRNAMDSGRAGMHGSGQHAATMHRSQLGVALGRRSVDAPMKIDRPAGPDSFHSFGNRARLVALFGLKSVASRPPCPRSKTAFREMQTQRALRRRPVYSAGSARTGIGWPCAKGLRSMTWGNARSSDRRRQPIRRCPPKLCQGQKCPGGLRAARVRRRSEVLSSNYA